MSAVTASRGRSAPARRAVGRGASPVPRRISGPVGGRARLQPRPHQPATAGARALALVRSLPDHSLIDRLVRGRAWIPVLGVLLVGIVAMQVEILKAGTSLGRSLERTASLQGQNESLQAGVAGLADYQRIENLATGMGMVMPTPALLTFVGSGSGSQAELGAGLGNIHAPDPAAFASQLATQVIAADQIASSSTTTSSQATSTQSTAPSGSTTSVAAAGTTSSAALGTSSTGADSAATGVAGTATTAPVAPTGTTPSSGSTTGAPADTAAPTAGTGTSAGAAGLPTTSTSQSG